MNQIPKYLYRGVSEKVELEGRALKPHYGDFTKPFLGHMRAGLSRVGDSLGPSVANAIKEHQSCSSQYKHSALSTSSSLEIALHYALHERIGEEIKQLNTGYIYKIETSKLKNIKIEDTSSNPAQAKPHDKEYILTVEDLGCEFDLGVVEQFKVSRYS
jgi:hypothetical protein